MRLRIVTGWVVACALSFFISPAACQTADLSGMWNFRLDPAGAGVREKWFDQDLPDSIRLPGSLQCQGYGDQVSPETVWWSGKLGGIWRSSPVYARYRQPAHVKILEWLQPEKHYIGAAWYQREVHVPRAWEDRRIVLFLERVHWASTLWVDGRRVGSRISLATPQTYDLSAYLRPGSTHRLTVRVDNSHIVDVGDAAHSVSDETQTAWNGIVGKIRLEATPRVWLSDVQVYPDIRDKVARVHITVDNTLSAPVTAAVELKVSEPGGRALKTVRKNISIHGKEASLAVCYPMGSRVSLWDEFHPSLYHLSVRLYGSVHGTPLADTSTSRVTFGMRQIGAAGTRFELNGHLISWRGDVNCGVFPLTGYPAMDTAWWRKLFRTYKSWGLNAVRFHSWCPPQAAFAAADETGIYLQPEVDEWCTFRTARQDSFFRAESALILKRYGNHPSFMLLALGNEKRADATMLRALVDTWEKDPRHLYTGKTAGSPVLDDFQYYNGGQFGPLRIRYHKGWPPVPTSTLFNTLAPQTTIDFRKGVAAYAKPLIAHETGQRCAYPDVAGERPKYTGLLKAAYLDIAADQLHERGMWDETAAFVRSSGLWQVQLYKEEIEADMRTPGIGGFNLLSLEDFPGQTTAPVGMLDVFYQPKGYVTPAQFRHFCAPVVLLARMARRVWEDTDTFRASVELYNFGEGSFSPRSILCQITDTAGRVVFSRDFPARSFPLGANLQVGSVSVDCGRLKAPARYTLSVSARGRGGDGVSNAWNFWVFPHTVGTVDTSRITIAHVFDPQVEKKLKAGATVLLLPDTTTIKGRLPICFTGFYWTAFGLRGGESSADGLLCDPASPLFRYFPTSFHTGWQWWDLLTRARPMMLDYFDDSAPFPKSYRPLIQMIDSWKLNRKLAVLAEGRVGKGKLMICSIDLEHDLKARPATRSFRYSLLKYITSPYFDPRERLTPEMIRNLFIP